MQFCYFQQDLIFEQNQEQMYQNAGFPENLNARHFAVLPRLSFSSLLSHTYPLEISHWIKLISFGHHFLASSRLMRILLLSLPAEAVTVNSLDVSQALVIQDLR